MIKLKNLPRTTAAAVAIIVIYAAFTFTAYLAAGKDDTFIMLWAGQSIGLGSWFVNPNHLTQEVASSYIGPIIASTTKGMEIGWALLTIKLVGLMVSIFTLGILWNSRALFFERQTNLFGLALLVTTSFSPTFAYWSMGGLETPYHACLLLLFSITFVKSLLQEKAGKIELNLFAVGLLLTLVRTESFWPVFLAGFAIPVAVRFVRIRKAMVTSVWGVVASFFVLLEVRYFFTGHLWPNPVYAKVGYFRESIGSGWAYMVGYFSSSVWHNVQIVGVVYSILAVLGLLRFAFHRERPSNQAMFHAFAGALVCMQIAFMLFSGGNWMEYYRFFACIVPLLNVMVFGFCEKIMFRFPIHERKAMAVIAFLAILSLGQLFVAERLDFRESVDLVGILSGQQTLDQQVIFKNRAYRRDWNSIKPFIDAKLEGLINDSGGKITVVSYQGGFFPYYIRQIFAPDRVWFVDSVGLNDQNIAILPGHKNNLGQVDGWRIDLALMGKAGALSIYLDRVSPNLVYQLSANEDQRQNFESMGFQLVWEMPGAVVFYRRRGSIE